MVQNDSVDMLQVPENGYKIGPSKARQMTPSTKFWEFGVLALHNDRESSGCLAVVEDHISDG